MFKILNKKVLNSSTSQMTLFTPDIANSAKAGQFVIIRVDEKGERIPLTIADWNKDLGTIDIIYQKIGVTTSKLDAKNIGEFILDIVGPLGKASNLEKYQNILIIGGGTGSAIAYPQAKTLYKINKKVHIICGFKTKELIILENEMKKVSHSLNIVTNDGSNKNKGLVTDALLKFFNKNDNIDVVFTAGPLPMMKEICNITRKLSIKTIVSMNPIMIDGTGMCGGCRVSIDGVTKFACIDGPDFDGHHIDFDEIIIKNRYSPRKNCKLLRGE